MNSQPQQKKAEVIDGVVVEALPNTFFKVELSTGETLLTYLAGKMRVNRIRVLIGDKVKVEIDPYGGKGRIIQRM
jgi:translation initiation factor IF-1